MIPFARVAVVRLVRDRSNLFFVLVFPLLLVLLIGLTFGGEPAATSVVVAGPDGRVREVVLEVLEEDGFTVDLDDRDEARRALGSGRAEVAVIVPEVADDATGTVEVVVNGPDADSVALQLRLDSAIVEATMPTRVSRALASLGIDVPASAVGADGASVALTSTVVDQPDGDSLAEQFEGLGRFDLGATSQLLLFVFITTLASATGVVQARRWGIIDRALAGPTRPTAVVAGLALGQLAVALVQSAVIIVVTALLFEVNWGDPVATAGVVVAFSSVAAAAGLLLGSVLESEERVGGVAPPVALVLAALGGSMLPLELFPDWLRRIANVTPHAWGNTAFAEIVRRDAGLVDVLPNIGVLLVFTLVLGGTAAVLLRRRIARA